MFGLRLCQFSALDTASLTHTHPAGETSPKLQEQSGMLRCFLEFHCKCAVKRRIGADSQAAVLHISIDLNAFLRTDLHVA